MVKLGLEPEERELRDEAREFLAEHCPDPAEHESLRPTSSTSQTEGAG
jgi:hypothetical protein